MELNSTEICLPRVRPDLTIHLEQEGRFECIVHDPILNQKTGLDSIGKFVFFSLKTPTSAQALLRNAAQSGENRLNARLLHKHIRFFSERGLLEGIRSQSNSRCTKVLDRQNSTAQMSELSLVYESGLKHQCQASGGCCSATDVGPISSRTVQDIAAYNWKNDIDGVDSIDDLFREEKLGTNSIYLTQMRHDQCVFLSENKRCLVHSKLGMAKKPSPCRQFPYVFSRMNDEIFVSLQMECREHWKAKNAAEPTENSELLLRDLLRTGAQVHSNDRVVRVDSGLQIDSDTYLAMEKRMISAVRNADKNLGVVAPIVAFAEATNLELAELYNPIMEEESQFTDSSFWNSAFPGQFSAESDEWEKFLGQVSSFEHEMSEFMSQAISIANERKLPWLAQRFDILGQYIHAACSQTNVDAYKTDDEDGIRGVIEDIIVSSLFSKEIVRHNDLRLGLAIVGFRAWLTLTGACHRAKGACRVTITVQDVIDSMVTISKMLRERAIIEVLRELKKPLIFVFLTNIGVFAHQGAPRLGGPGGI